MMPRAPLLTVALTVLAALALVMPAAAVQSHIITLKSGNVVQDPQVWVQGSDQVRPGLRSSGAPLDHPFIVATPSYWADLGGGAHWLTPMPNGSGYAGGYEYFTEFTPPDDLLTATLDLVWRGDDVAMPAINGTRFLADGSYDPSAPPGVLHIDLMPLLQPGVNRMSFFVENLRSNGDTDPTGINFLGNITYTRAAAPTSLSTTSLKSGELNPRDPQVWVQGSAGVRPGLPSSGLPLQHPFVVRKTPAIWAEVGGNAHWDSPSSDDTGPPGGYEYYAEFTVPDDFLTATLDLMWRGDGAAAPAVNGMSIPSVSPGGAKGTPAILHIDLKPFLQRGTNRLSFFLANSRSVVGSTGVDFLANITYTR